MPNVSRAELDYARALQKSLRAHRIPPALVSKADLKAHPEAIPASMRGLNVAKLLALAHMTIEPGHSSPVDVRVNNARRPPMQPPKNVCNVRDFIKAADEQSRFLDKALSDVRQL